MGKKNVTALALFSGGLDSMLACRVIAAQGIDVVAVKFVTPFFGYNLIADQEAYIQNIKKKYNIDVVVHNISDTYLRMLSNPSHGYGKNFNPCLDCKILMLTEAWKMLADYGASFIITGEVVGQRPMSQRLDTLKLIARESGCEDILVRPLCAQSLKITKPESEGLVDREKLLNFKGRSRKDQIELAKQFGISDYPNPAGGCVLTDISLSKRIEKFYEEHDKIEVDDIAFLLRGRQFILPDGAWLMLGRDELENEKVLSMQKTGDWLLKVQERPGPTALLRYSSNKDEVELAAGIVLRYSKKVDGKAQKGIVRAVRGDDTLTFDVEPLDDATFQTWIR